MTAILAELAMLNVAAAIAIGAVMIMRRHVRRYLGPHAAYLAWAVVPVAMLATLLPARTVTIAASAQAADASWTTTMPPVVATVLIAAWLAGVVVMLVTQALRQYAFERDVARGEAGPAVAGFFYPRIVTPGDFTERFSQQEQRLILTHEQVHLERGDARINALATLARCLFWFNPLVHAAAACLRADQEAACDAEVIDRRPRARRIYAETLLKTQLTARPLPAGCYWPEETPHPLTERIGMLARAPLSAGRRVAAIAAVALMIGAGGFAAWAAQPAREIIVASIADESDPDILVAFAPLAPDDRMAPREELVLVTTIRPAR